MVAAQAAAAGKHLVLISLVLEVEVVIEVLVIQRWGRVIKDM
jgi:hypothetical protein